MEESVSPIVVITNITFSDGTDIPLSKNDVIVVVGPNNAGKSSFLRGIRDKLNEAAHKNPVLQSIEILRIGDLKIFTDWLMDWTVQYLDASSADPTFQAFGHAVRESNACNLWSRSDNDLRDLSPWFCRFLSADERLQICNPPENIALARDYPRHPIHFLLRDDNLEIQMSTKFRKAFGVDIIVHRNAGNQVPLHTGDRPEFEPGEDRVSIGYIKKIEKLPTLHTQGDGMRSFAGVLLATAVGQESIMLIDEPEAFLHPPQARLLGTMLAKDRDKERQLFIATHSTDILRGILNAESSEVKIIRIRRDQNKNTVLLLNNKRVKELWDDPLLRYSNILDGLFHESVVVCEADADCRFYAAVLDAVLSKKSEDVKRPDLMFTHCGGKSRLPVVIRALREVNVPVCAVADFDVLSEEEPLKSITESLGINWTDINADWQIVKNAVDNKKPDLQTSDVIREINTLLSNIATSTFPPKIKSDIQSILKRSSPWAHAKLAGKVFVPSGDPSKACERLLGKLRAGGLFVVEVGELEGFVRTEGGHGPKWVNNVLRLELATDPALETARKFVSDLAGV